MSRWGALPRWGWASFADSVRRSSSAADLYPAPAVRGDKSLRLAGSRRTIAQDGNVFQRAAEARLRLGVIEVDEPLADPLLARIVSGPNESANEARP